MVSSSDWWQSWRFQVPSANICRGEWSWQKLFDQLIFSKYLKKPNFRVSLLFIELLYKLCVHYQKSAAEKKRIKIKSKDWQKLRCTCCVCHKFKVCVIIGTKWQLSHFHPMNLWTSFVVEFTLIPTNVLIWKLYGLQKSKQNLGMQWYGARLLQQSLSLLIWSNERNFHPGVQKA